MCRRGVQARFGDIHNKSEDGFLYPLRIVGCCSQTADHGEAAEDKRLTCGKRQHEASRFDKLGRAKIQIGENLKSIVFRRRLEYAHSHPSSWVE